MTANLHQGNDTEGERVASLVKVTRLALTWGDGRGKDARKTAGRNGDNIRLIYGLGFFLGGNSLSGVNDNGEGLMLDQETNKPFTTVCV